jgi:micrococcal nuclease
MMNFNFYFYKAKVTNVYDGDTITVDIDLGFNVILRNQKIRLFGINTPEIRGLERESGLISKKWLKEKVLGKEIVLESIKDKTGKYGRILGILHLNDETIGHNVFLNINEEIINLGLGKIYK